MRKLRHAQVSGQHSLYALVMFADIFGISVLHGRKECGIDLYSVARSDDVTETVQKSVSSPKEP